MLKRILCFFLIAVSFCGCLKEEERNCSYDACAYKAPASQIQAVKDYLAANNLTAQEHCSGLFYIIDAEGSGSTPNICNTVSTTYTGKFTNGSQFDSGTASFGLDRVISGWTIGIPLIKKGGKIRLFLPPYLGYGSQDRKDENGNVVIPGNSILIFDVTLNDVY